jgi:hypothetical protein
MTIGGSNEISSSELESVSKGKKKVSSAHHPSFEKKGGKKKSRGKKVTAGKKV